MAVSDACLQVPHPQLLADVLSELRQKADLTTVRIVAPRVACGLAVRRELERAGVSPGRLESVTRPAEYYVQFEVAVWKGARCN